jgi:murein DD-endopeptidase / murein LD-carboxypeptidase
MNAKAQIIAARAVSQIGVPFKLHGRLPGAALDCVGLVGYAIAPFDAQDTLPRDYRLRGDYLINIKTYLENSGLFENPNREIVADGDILLSQVGLGQHHLMIRVRHGFVHAHSGLRRVVLTPGPSPWPIIKCWRMAGG